MSPKAARDEQTRWLRVKEVFSEASEAEPEERDLIVDTRCGTDKEMADEVRSLLRLAEEDGLSHVPQYPHGAASPSRSRRCGFHCLWLSATSRGQPKAAGALRHHAKWLTEAYLATQRGENLQGRDH